jgi:RNA polymerase sigma-70 factor (ECF subfamily)
MNTPSWNGYGMEVSPHHHWRLSTARRSPRNVRRQTIRKTFPQKANQVTITVTFIAVPPVWESAVMPLPEQTPALLDRIRAGDGAALGELFTHYRERLWRMVHLRLDRRILRRVSPDDVLQEAFLDVARRIGEFLANPAVPFYVWLRFLTIQRLQMVQRTHLGAQMRSVGMESALGPDGMPFASADSIADKLFSRMTSPSQAAIRHEMQAQLRAALDEMDPMDREVLALRHFEELANNEVAQVLGLSKEAASKRYLRALKRLKEFLAASPGCFLTSDQSRASP